ncbi:unnamed protein product, partial [Brassica napus]
MSSKNSMNANKHFNKEASPQSKIKKLKYKLGPQWTKDELDRFYEAYQKQGRDWKKVAASVENNRSVDMVEALFSMNQAYLSLPEASVDGLVATMTDHYCLFLRRLNELNNELQKLECKVAFVTDVRNGEFRFDIKRSRAQLYEEVKGKYEAIGRDLTDYSFLLDLPISSLCQESFRDLQEARDKVK